MKKKYTINETFFEKIDSEEKAYFLGFLYSDGYIHKDRGTINLQQAEDKYMLERLNTLIGSNRPLLLIKNRKYNEKDGKNRRDAYRLRINSRKITNDLFKLGCYQAKSLTLKFPKESQVSSCLIRHFIRGFFDGDGCLVVYFPKGRNCVQADIKIVTTEDFVEKLGSLTSKILNIGFNVTKRFKDNKNCYNYQLSGNSFVLRFLEWIYKDSKIHLKRKHDKMIYLVNEVMKRKKHKAYNFILNSKFLSQYINPKKHEL